MNLVFLPFVGQIREKYDLATGIGVSLIIGIGGSLAFLLVNGFEKKTEESNSSL